MKRSVKSKTSARKRYFYWKYRREHPEKFQKKAKTMQRMGASEGMSSFLASIDKGKKYRIRYQKTTDGALIEV